MTHTLSIEYGDDLLATLCLSPEQFSDEARLLLAVKLYELGRITSGRAAQLGGLDRVAFLQALLRLGVPASNLRPEDAGVELTFARGA